jgi:hypothetical protein
MKITSNLTGLDDIVSKRNLRRANLVTRQQMLRDMNRLVPKRSDEDRTNLRGSAYLDHDNSIIYNTVYAKAQFYGIITDRNGGKHPVRHYTTSGTGKRWDLRGKQLYGKQWLNTYRKAVLHDK